jgi:CRISPR/Cas system-associated exonuclease Cas4 (RecB family)
MVKRTNKSEVIAASEISQYVYCPVSWYLKRMGAPARSPYLERGIREHIGAGKRLSILEKKDKASRTFRLLEYSSALFAILLLGWFLRQNF